MEDYLSEVARCLDSVSSDIIDAALNTILEVTKNNRKVLVIGNGGSAALASHFVTDLLKSGSQGKTRISAFSLVDNSALLTATSNDFRFVDVFTWQMKQIANSGDLLVAISSSGNSDNIIEALKLAKSLGLKTLTLSGFDGGKISKISDVAIITNSAIGNYGPVEDSHSIICHYLARRISHF